MTIKNAMLAGLFTVVLAGVSNDAHGTPFTFRFGGVVTSSQVAGITAGNSISGVYTFDSAATAQFPNSSAVAAYNTSISSYSLQVGSFGASSSSGQILVANNFNGTIDGYVVGAGPMTTTPLAGLTAIQSFFELIDGTGTAISAFALPLTPPDLSDFSFRNYVLRFVDQGNVRYQVSGSINALEAVPAPGALALVGLGLVVLAAAGRKKASHSVLGPGARR